jgi:hypothetical protein
VFRIRPLDDDTWSAARREANAEADRTIDRDGVHPQTGTVQIEARSTLIPDMRGEESSTHDSNDLDSSEAGEAADAPSRGDID